MKKRRSTKKVFTRILAGFTLAFAVVLTVFFGINSNKSKSEIDKYNLEHPNLIQYDDFGTLKKVIDTDDTFVIYFGKPECPYCQRYVPVVNEYMYSINMPLLYFNAESIKGSYYDENGTLTLNEKYKEVIDWIKDNSVVDAKENSWVGSKTVSSEEHGEQTVDWLMVPRFFRVQNGKIVNCFKSYTEAEEKYKVYVESEEKDKDIAYRLFTSDVITNYKTFMSESATTNNSDNTD